MWRKKKSLSFLPPWEFQTPVSLGTPRLPINLPRKWLSHHLGKRERLYSNCSKGQWSACGPSSDELMMSQHHQPSGATALGSTCLGVAYHHGLLQNGGGFSICKTVQRYYCVHPLMWKQDFAPRLLLTVCFSLVSHPLPSLINNWLNLQVNQQVLELEFREDHGGWMKPTRPPDLPPEKSVCKSRSNS